MGPQSTASRQWTHQMTAKATLKTNPHLSYDISSTLDVMVMQLSLRILATDEVISYTPDVMVKTV
jgi:hypothetical protein